MSRASQRALVFILAIGAVRSLAADSLDLTGALRLYDTRRYSEARECFRQLASEKPDEPELDFYLGRLALWFDDEADALSHLERAAQRAPDQARIQNALGDAYGLKAQTADLFAKLGWARKCLAAYECAVRLEPGNTAYRWSLLGYHSLAPRIAGGVREKAFAQAAEIKRLDPAAGRIAYATLYLAEKSYAAAFAQFDGVLRDSPDDFLALYHIGRCAALSGEQLERGRSALQRCLTLVPPIGDGMPTRASAHYRLANILEKKGDFAGARAEYAAALLEQPDFRPTKIALKN